MGRIIQILLFIRDLITGKYTLANKQTANDRMNICNDCLAKNDNTCTACGCYLPLKTRLRESECPMDEWPLIVKQD